MTSRDHLSVLTDLALTARDRSHVPYSRTHRGCALLLSDGLMIPGSRVESASFSLLIPAVVNAFSTAAAAGRTDIVAVQMDDELRREDVAFLSDTFAGKFAPQSRSLAILDGTEHLPTPGEILHPYVESHEVLTEAARLDLVRDLAARAVTPQSKFPVACILFLQDGKAIPGVNVEHTDWARIICAERNALGTMISYGLQEPTQLWLTCSRDATCSPCGACRQLLAELAPDILVMMDRGSDPPEQSSPSGLIPGFFTGTILSASDQSHS